MIVHLQKFLARDNRGPLASHYVILERIYLQILHFDKKKWILA